MAARGTARRARMNEVLEVWLGVATLGKERLLFLFWRSFLFCGGNRRGCFRGYEGDGEGVEEVRGQ